MPPRDLVLVSACALLTLGVVVVQSAGMTVTSSGDLTALATSKTVWLALAAMAALVIGRRLPQSWLTSPTLAITVLVASLVLLLAVFVPGFGREVNGARRWIDFGPIGFQPSEIAKWSLVIFLAWYASRRPTQMGLFRHGIGPALIVVTVICGLTVLEDLGTAVLMATVAVLILLAAGARLWHFAAMAIPACGALAVAIIAEPYRVQRLQTFLNPWSDPGDSGYHMIQSMKAIAGGGIGGRGLGNGVQKFDYLPEDTTDFIFAIIVEELGVAGCLVVVFLFLTLIWSGWRIVQMQQHSGRQLLALGITATITLQAIMNLYVVTGLAPTKGIALPLISSGGTGWIITGCMLGILARLDCSTGQQNLIQTGIPAPAT